MTLRELVESLETASKKNQLYPGSATTWLLLSICGAIVVIAGEGQGLEKAERTLKSAALAFPVAIALWQIGSFWDDWLFDPVFKPATDHLFPWVGRNMREARRKTAWFFKHGRRPLGKVQTEDIKGVYERAAHLYKSSNAWSQKVQLRLEWSKFFRSLIVLPLVVFLYDTFQPQLPQLIVAPENVLSEFAWLGSMAAAWSSLTLAIVFAGLYVWLRVRHMEELYHLAGPDGDAEFRYIEGFHGFDRDACEIHCDGYVLFVSRLEMRRVYRPGSLTEQSLDFLYRVPEDRWQADQAPAAS